MGLAIDTFRYFSHDADMRNDIKIKALRRKFGNTGYAVWCFILETLTDKEDFEILFTDVEQELLAADFDVTTEELCNIVEYCIKVNLLQANDNKIFSERHKERLNGVIQQKEYKREIAKKAIEARWNKEKLQSNNKSENSDTDVLQSNNKSNTINREEENREDKIRIDKNIIIPYQEIVTLWNSTCVKLPKIIKLNDNRRQKIKCRMQEFGETPDDKLDTYKSILSLIAKSDFLNGENNHNWIATFDWLFENSANWTKVLEGNYNNKRGVKSAPVSASNNLGMGEYIDNSGRRTYGTGKANIPMSAPPRPSESYTWDESTHKWIML